MQLFKGTKTGGGGRYYVKLKVFGVSDRQIILFILACLPLSLSIQKCTQFSYRQHIQECHRMPLEYEESISKYFVFAGSLESANSSILASCDHFKEVVGKIIRVL